MMMDKDVLDVKGVAEMMGVTERTVRALAANGKLPGRKVGKEWRFSRPGLLRWLEDGQGGSQSTNDGGDKGDG